MTVPSALSVCRLWVNSPRRKVDFRECLLKLRAEFSFDKIGGILLPTGTNRFGRCPELVRPGNRCRNSSETCRGLVHTGAVRFRLFPALKLNFFVNLSIKRELASIDQRNPFSVSSRRTEISAFSGFMYERAAHLRMVVGVRGRPNAQCSGSRHRQPSATRLLSKRSGRTCGVGCTPVWSGSICEHHTTAGFDALSRRDGFSRDRRLTVDQTALLRP